MFFSKSNTSYGNPFFAWAPQAASDELRIRVAQSTTHTEYQTDNANCAANKWWFIAADYDVGGASRHHIYRGDLTTAATECTYSVNQDGSGTRASDASWPFVIGNRRQTGVWAVAYRGDIAWVGLWNRVLTLKEIIEQQFRPHKTSGCVLFTHLGFNGTGTQYDLSGNGNNGTVTGASVADHVPLTLPFGYDLGTINFSTATADTEVLAGVDNLVLTEQTATVNAETNVQASFDTLTITTYQANIAINVDISTNVTNLTLTENTAVVNAETNISASIDNLILTENVATVNARTNIQASLDTLVLTTYQASLAVATEVLASVDNLVLTENAASVNAETNVLASLGLLAITEYQANISLDTSIAASYDTLTLATYGASIIQNINILASTDALALTPYQSTVDTTGVAVQTTAYIDLISDDPKINLQSYDPKISLQSHEDSIIIKTIGA
jgi:hypothetical protein